MFFHPGEECPLVCKKDLILVPASGFRPLHHLLASPQCVPWAPNGPNLGLSDPDVETFFQLAHLIRHDDPDMATIEENKRMPKHLLMERVGPKFQFVSAVFGPQHLGFPTNRQRLHGTFINLESLVWLGPSEDKDIQQDFEQLFFRKIMLDGDCFAGMDNLQNQWKQTRVLCHRRGSYPQSEEALDLRSILPCAQRDAYDKYRMQFALHEHCGFLHGGLVGDLSSSESRLRSSPLIPTMQKSSVIASMSASPPGSSTTGGYMYTMNELRLAHGWPSIAIGRSRVYQDCVPLDFEKASLNVQHELLGNGLHLGSLSAWLWYVQSNLIRRDVLQQMPPPMMSAAASSPRSVTCIDLSGDTTQDQAEADKLDHDETDDPWAEMVNGVPSNGLWIAEPTDEPEDEAMDEAAPSRGASSNDVSDAQSQPDESWGQ